jgi:hypothetical protein
MVSRHARLAKNQELSRRANERLNERVAAMLLGDRPIPFLCECADGTCTEPVSLTEDEYVAVRAEDSRFAIVPGHAMLDDEDVVEEHELYDVVEKRLA